MAFEDIDDMDVAEALANGRSLYDTRASELVVARREGANIEVATWRVDAQELGRWLAAGNAAEDYPRPWEHDRILKVSAPKAAAWAVAEMVSSVWVGDHEAALFASTDPEDQLAALTAVKPGLDVGGARDDRVAQRAMELDEFYHAVAAEVQDKAWDWPPVWGLSVEFDFLPYPSLISFDDFAKILPTASERDLFIAIDFAKRSAGDFMEDGNRVPTVEEIARRESEPGWVSNVAAEAIGDAASGAFQDVTPEGYCSSSDLERICREYPETVKLVDLETSVVLMQAARQLPFERKVELGTQWYEDMKGTLFDCASIGVPACWGTQVRLVDGDDVGYVDMGLIARAMPSPVFETYCALSECLEPGGAGTFTDLFERARNTPELRRMLDAIDREDRSVGTSLTRIMPDDFTDEQLDMLYEQEPGLFDTSVCEEYERIAETVERASETRTGGGEDFGDGWRAEAREQMPGRDADFER